MDWGCVRREDLPRNRGTHLEEDRNEAEEDGDDFHGGSVGDSEAIEEVGLDAESTQPLVDLGATAVDEDFKAAPPYLTMMGLPRNFWMKGRDS
ncbi:unnamed protein product [Camellia sinensis]